MPPAGTLVTVLLPISLITTYMHVPAWSCSEMAENQASKKGSAQSQFAPPHVTNPHGFF